MSHKPHSFHDSRLRSSRFVTRSARFVSPSSTALFSLFVAMLISSASTADNWPRFRGPNGSGVAAKIDFPLTWSHDDYAWKAALPGIGHSSPVIWGNQLFVQTGSAAGDKQFLLCFDTSSGRELWRREFDSLTYSKHVRNSFGSSTPVVDGTGVYFVWGSKKQQNVTKLSHDGNSTWTQSLGPFQGRHGPALPVVVVGETVICPVFQESYASRTPVAGESPKAGYVAAFDRMSGQPAWRSECTPGRASYATPCVVSHQNSPEQQLIFSNSSEGMFSLDPATGNENWSLPVFDKRTISSPFQAGDLVIGTCGSGGGGNTLVAIECTAGQPPREAYRVKHSPYVPTPVFKDGLIYLWHDRGILTCVDATDGSRVWKERVGESLSGSPICVGDRLVAMTDAGEVIVVATGRSYKLLGKSDLGEPTRATPAADGKRIYFRTESQLFALGALGT